MCHFVSFFLEFKSNLLVKIAFFLLKAVYSMSILHLMLRVDFALYVIRLAKWLKYWLTNKTTNCYGGRTCVYR